MMIVMTIPCVLNTIKANRDDRDDHSVRFRHNDDES